VNVGSKLIRDGIDQLTGLAKVTRRSGQSGSPLAWIFHRVKLGEVLADNFGGAITLNLSAPVQLLVIDAFVSPPAVATVEGISSHHAAAR